MCRRPTLQPWPTNHWRDVVPISAVESDRSCGISRGNGATGIWLAPVRLVSWRRRLDTVALERERIGRIANEHRYPARRRRAGCCAEAPHQFGREVRRERREQHGDRAV